MITDSKDMVIDRSVDIRFAVAKRGELDKPIKTMSVHRRCTTPLWKIIVWIAVGVLIFIVLKKAKSRAENNS